jgi:hypothetical protein
VALKSHYPEKISKRPKEQASEKGIKITTEMGKGRLHIKKQPVGKIPAVGKCRAKTGD